MWLKRCQGQIKQENVSPEGSMKLLSIFPSLALIDSVIHLFAHLPIESFNRRFFEGLLYARS